jgi:hypothetical protein
MFPEGPSETQNEPSAARSTFALLKPVLEIGIREMRAEGTGRVVRSLTFTPGMESRGMVLNVTTNSSAGAESHKMSADLYSGWPLHS